MGTGYATQFSKSKLVLIIGIVLVATFGMFFVPAIQQDPAYHLFADHRHLVGVNHFWNVVSNLPFLTIGLCGLWLVWEIKRKQVSQIALQKATPLFTVFFTGILFTGLGSSYYHFNPNNLTLVFDRLPMTVAFMAFFCMIIGYHVNMIAAKRLLAPLLVLGLGSVGYWFATELVGHGDLRPYVLVQFLPMVLVPLLLSKNTGEFLRAKAVWLVIGYYAMAKVFEHWDADIYDHLIVLSGHSIKHVIAALGAYVVYVHVKRDWRRTAQDQVLAS